VNRAQSIAHRAAALRTAIDVVAAAWPTGPAPSARGLNPLAAHRNPLVRDETRRAILDVAEYLALYDEPIGVEATLSGETL
jgi:hypothetical protein